MSISKCMFRRSANFRELTHFKPMSISVPPENIMFSGGIERDQWHEMSSYQLLKIISIEKL